MRRILTTRSVILVKTAVFAALVLVPAICAQEEGLQDRFEQKMRVYEILENCIWGRSSFGEEPRALEEIEILVPAVGKITIKRNHLHAPLGASTQEVRGDSYELMTAILAANPKVFSPCEQMPVVEKRTEALEPQIVKHIEGLRELQQPFDIEDAIVLHQPMVELRIRMSNFEFRTEWFGCDSSEAARWAQKLANLLDTQLDPCLYPKADP